VLRQPLNLTPPVIVEWDIKLSLYQSCVITFISSINKVGEGVTNQYDRVLVGRVAFLVFISNSNIMREVKCRCSESVERYVSVWRSFVSGLGGDTQVKNVRGVFQPSSSFHPTPRRELTTFVLSLSSSNRTRRGKCKKYI
jgi:hypothetical protein